MLSLNDAMLKKRQEPAFAAPWDALEPEEQIVRAIIEGREENHLTQEQLAEKLELSPAFIGHVEAPNVNKAVSLDTLFDVAAALDVPPYKFLQFDE